MSVLLLFFFSDGVCDVKIIADEGKSVHYQLTFNNVENDSRQKNLGACRDDFKIFDGNVLNYSTVCHVRNVWELEWTYSGIYRVLKKDSFVVKVFDGKTYLLLVYIMYM